MLFKIFQFTFICKYECDVIVGYWILSHEWMLSEVDSGYYPTQMERRDCSDSFVYVTITIIVIQRQSLQYLLFVNFFSEV